MLVDNATLIQSFKCEHSYLNFWKHSTNKQIDPCGWGSLTRSARRRRRGMNDAYMYTVLTLSLHFLTHYTVATYIWPTLYMATHWPHTIERVCECTFVTARFFNHTTKSHVAILSLLKQSLLALSGSKILNRALIISISDIQNTSPTAKSYNHSTC